MKELVSTRILHELKQRFEEVKWNSGQKLPSLAALASEFKVGVSTVREALRILENNGYLLIEQGRGMCVRSHNNWQQSNHLDLSDLPSGDLLSLQEFRILLEPEMAKLAAERALSGQILWIHDVASSSLFAVEKGEDY